jgi:predicted dehydrogenase
VRARSRGPVEAPAARIDPLGDLLESPDIDIIAIATPNHLHAAQAVAASLAQAHPARSPRR